MKLLSILWLVIGSDMIIISGVSARIINIPSEYSTIQAGINASINGDTVLVQPGTYHERINFNGRGIVLGSSFLISGDTTSVISTIIDGDSAGSIVSFNNAENNTAIIKGFTLINGLSQYPENGGAIYCNNVNPIIESNIIRLNIAGGQFGRGGGICCDSANPLIVNNIIENNRGYSGGAIYCSGDARIINNIIINNVYANTGAAIDIRNCQPIVERNIIRDNSSGYEGVIYCQASNAIFINNLIVNNRGGMYISQSSPILINNILYGNYAYQGGGIQCYNSNPIILNSIFWENSAQYGNDIFIISGNSPLISYCDLQDSIWNGLGNISINPNFRNPGAEDLHLMSIACGDSTNSPCIDAGDPNIFDSLLACSWGLGTNHSDMGAYGGGDSISQGIEAPISEIPSSFSLSQSYPNPFNASTTIKYDLPKACDVSVDIYDILGRKIERLVSGKQSAGEHSIIWNVNDATSGVYFYKLQAGDYIDTKRCLLLK